MMRAYYFLLTETPINYSLQKYILTRESFYIEVFIVTHSGITECGYISYNTKTYQSSINAGWVIKIRI